MSLICISLSAQKPVSDIAATAQRASQHSTKLENWFEEMANWEQQLKTTIESTEWLSKTYSAAQFLGGSQQLMDFINTISRYKDLVQSCISDVESYSNSGLASFRQLQYTTSLVTQGLNLVTETLAKDFKTILTSNGMTVAERLSLLTELNDKLNREYWKLILTRKKNREKAAGVAGAADKRIISAMTMPSLEPPLSELENNISDVLNDPFTQQIYDDAQRRKQRYFTSGNTVERTAQEGRSHTSSAVTIASYLMGMAAAIFLVIAFERRNGGVGSRSQDAFYKVGIGFLFGLIALQIVSRYFSF